MASLAKLEKENERLRKTAANRSKMERLTRSATVVELSGQVGSKLGAVGCAALDAKLSVPGQIAKFGNSSVPIAPVVGTVLAVGSLMFVKSNPAIASGIGRLGTFGMDLGIYHGTRGMFEEMSA